MELSWTRRLAAWFSHSRSRRETDHERVLALCLAGLPGLAYLSGVSRTRVDIGEEITRLTLTGVDRRGFRLNGLWLRSPEEIEASAIARMGTAAAYSPPSGFARLVARPGKRPHWSVRFRRPIRIDRIEVINRKGPEGDLALGLTVAWRSAKGWSDAQPIISAGSLRSRLGRLATGAEALLTFRGEGSPCSAAIGSFAEAVHSLILDVGAALDDSTITLSALQERRRGALAAAAALFNDGAAIRMLLAADGLSDLLGALIWRGRSPSRKEPDESCALLLGWTLEFLRGAAVGGDRVQDNRGLIEQAGPADVERQLAGAYLRGGGCADALPITFRRHSVAPAWLHVHREAVAQRIADTIAALADAGYDAFVNYGTLLGAVRDGDFIAHDDDVDICILARATDIEAIEDEMTALAATLKAAGFRAGRARRPLLHLKFIDLPVQFDIFPVFAQAPGELTLFMERMNLRPIPADVILPLGTTELAGRSFPAPARAADMLELRYGAGWRVPERFFETGGWLAKGMKTA